MSGRLFYLGLGLGSAAMLLLLAGFLCLQFGLTLLMGLFYLIATKTMALALSVLALLGLAALCKAVYRDLRAYFCQESLVLRRLVSLYSQQQESQQLKIAKTRQVNYWARFQRQRLVAADNRKQARALADAVTDELQLLRTQLPHGRYKNLHKDLRKYRKQADSAALLNLRQELHVAD